MVEPEIMKIAYFQNYFENLFFTSTSTLPHNHFYQNPFQNIKIFFISFCQIRIYYIAKIRQKSKGLVKFLYYLSDFFILGYHFLITTFVENNFRIWNKLLFRFCRNRMVKNRQFSKKMSIQKSPFSEDSLAEIEQGLGRFLRCGARKPKQTLNLELLNLQLIGRHLGTTGWSFLEVSAKREIYFTILMQFWPVPVFFVQKLKCL